MAISFEQLTNKLVLVLRQASQSEVQDFAFSDEGKLILLQWKLLSNLKKHSKQLKQQWILSLQSVLELLLTSGYVKNHNWTELLDLLTEICELDDRVIGDSYRLKLAIAIAITFSTPVKSMASYGQRCINPIQRYKKFSCWADAGLFFPDHQNLSCWHLRYVVASWAEDSELEWAQGNVLDEYRNPQMIGEVAHKMVTYTNFNSSGVSVQNAEKFYNHQPQTLEKLSQVGAVCGGISKFGVGVSQAFGVPATPVAQPGHCAYLWWKRGNWVISNNVGGLLNSFNHDGIQWTWGKNTDFLLLMDEAQQDRGNFVVSERLRWASKFVENTSIRMQVLDLACNICPSNFLVWRDLVHTSGKVNLHCEVLVSWMHAEALKLDSSVSNIEVSLSAVVEVSDCHERAKNLIDGTDSEWWTNQEAAWVMLKFEQICKINTISVKWWGISVSKDYKVLAAGHDGIFHEVKTSLDEFEHPQGCNSWSRLGGWHMDTLMIKFELKNGHLDPWQMGKWFGIRQIKVIGNEVNSSSGESPLAAILRGKAKRCLSGHRKVLQAVNTMVVKQAFGNSTEKPVPSKPSE